MTLYNIFFSDNGTINAFNNHSTTSTLMTASSPTHSPNCPPGAIDIELEVGDHEVDTMFRDPGTKPIILARSTPPLQVRPGAKKMSKFRRKNY